MTTTQKHIPGVIGGMGPQATLDFLQKIVANTPASSDQQHIRLLIDHNPTVPNRHQAIASNDGQLGATLGKMAAGLACSGADFLVMVCNTAHAYQTDIEAAISVPFISIVDEVISELSARWRNAGRVGVMAAEGALAADLYQNALLARGLEPILWSGPELEQFMSLVYRVKAGEPLADIRQPMEALAQLLVDRGAEVLIAGCTEIPLVMPATRVPLLSSTDVLVARTIDYALGSRPLPRG